MTTTIAKVVSAMLADPAADRYGLDLMRDTGLASGTLYPVLVRLEAAGWLAAHWEAVDPAAEGRPARRYYRLTPTGAETGRVELARLRRALSRESAPVARTAGA